MLHHSVHPLPFLLEGGWGCTSNQIFKKGELDRTSTFRGGCWERWGDFFGGGLQFSQKKKKNSNI